MVSCEYFAFVGHTHIHLFLGGFSLHRFNLPSHRIVYATHRPIGKSLILMFGYVPQSNWNQWCGVTIAQSTTSTANTLESKWSDGKTSVNLGKWKYGNKLDLFGRYLYSASSMPDLMCACGGAHQIPNITFIIMIMCNICWLYWVWFEPSAVRNIKNTSHSAVSWRISIRILSVHFYAPCHHHRTPLLQNQIIKFAFTIKVNTLALGSHYIVGTKRPNVLNFKCNMISRKISWRLCAAVILIIVTPVILITILLCVVDW